MREIKINYAAWRAICEKEQMYVLPNEYEYIETIKVAEPRYKKNPTIFDVFRVGNRQNEMTYICIQCVCKKNERVAA